MKTMHAHSLRPNDIGFTLIEVLVAMAILSMGMIAVFSGISQSLSATTRLRDKTLATWIATDRITELQISGEYPDAGTRRDQIEMAHTEWVYNMQISDIPEIAMRRIDITVSFADAPNDTLATVIGFIGPNQTTGQKNTPATQIKADESQNGFGSGWEPPQENFGETG